MPNKFMKKAKEKFNYYTDKVIKNTSPKVQKEIRRVASKSVDNLISSVSSIAKIGIAVTFVGILAKDISAVPEAVTNDAYASLIKRGLCIVYNDVNNTYNYYSKEVA